MSSTHQIFAARPPVSRRPRGYGQLHGADLRWAIAVVLPYAAVFFVFVVYPFGYALWMAGRPALYAELIAGTRTPCDLHDKPAYDGIWVWAAPQQT
jgi:hypothetical protein